MIEAITQDEFEAARLTLGRRPSPESMAVAALKPQEGIKMPCRWKHYKGHACYGCNGFNRLAKRHDMAVSATCKDGTLYVFRYE